MLVFLGTSHRSAIFLEKATQNGLKFDLVVSEPAKIIGRKKILTENPTILIAKEKKIPYIVILNEVKNLIGDPSAPPQDDIGLILDYNKIISNEIINLFSKGIINIHFSKLPQYRGPAPVQYTISNGDKEAWITYYLISEKLDEGKILSQISIPLDFTETTDSLYEKLIIKAAGEVPKIIAEYLEGKIMPKPQTGTPTVTKKLTAENCRIDWKKSPHEIERLIRAAYSEPGAWCVARLDIGYSILEKRLKILKAHLENSKLILDEVQLEGKKPVSWQQFKQGHPEAKLLQS